MIVAVLWTLAAIAVLARVLRRKRPRPGLRLVPTRCPPDVRWEVWARDDFTCRRCGTRRRLSVDRVVPGARGGPYTVENCQTLCQRCNSSKGAR